MKIKIKLLTGQTIRFLGDINYHFEKDTLIIEVGSYSYEFIFSDMKYFTIGTRHEVR